MFDTRRWVGHVLTVSVAAVLSACAPMAVKDIAADKTGYMDENFSPKRLSGDVTKKLGTSNTAAFQRVKIRYNASIESSDGKKESSTMLVTYTNAGNGLVQEMREYSNNDIPFGIQYELSYAGLLPLRFQQVQLRRQTANFIIETKQITSVSKNVLQSQPDAEYVFEWFSGTSIQLANFSTSKLVCRAGKPYSAATLNPKFSGTAVNLDCELHRNGILASKQKMAVLRQYGLVVRQESSNASDKSTYTITAVEEIR